MTGVDTKIHRQVWDLIPWRLNDTLSEEETRLVDDHVATCAECAAEIACQRRLIEVVAAEIPTPNQADALERISARLVDQTRGGGVVASLSRFVGAVFSGGLRGVAVGGGLAVGCVAAAVIYFGEDGRCDLYQTVTSPDASSEAGARGGVEIRLRFAEGVDAAEIRAALEAAGAVDVDGPSETGLIRATLAGGDIKAVIDDLSNDPRILFVARD